MKSLSVTGIGKSYDGNPALRDVSFSAARGTVLAVCGENGAGKSTLMKILSGATRPDTGTLRIDGEDINVAAGESVFIKRGVVHGFTNSTAEPATCLCTLTPGVLGPSYFKEMAALLAGGAPDPAKMKATMLRYGLIPAPPKPAA